MPSYWFQAENFFSDRRMREAGFANGMTTLMLGNMKEEENRQAAMTWAGLGGRRVLTLRQVHGDRIVTPEDFDRSPGLAADGWISDGSQDVLAVFVADCLPLFLWNARAKAAGVFHVGWRGAKAELPKKAVAAFLERYNADPLELQAAIGPHIQPCCFEVGPEVVAQFRESSCQQVDGKTCLDLKAEVTAQLLESGVAGEGIGTSHDCTRCRSDMFFSFRREKRDQRMMAFLGWSS